MDLPDCQRPSEPFPAAMLELPAANTGTSVAGTKSNKLQHCAAVVAAGPAGPPEIARYAKRRHLIDSAAPVLRAALCAAL
jgi:hypothetical protein